VRGTTELHTPIACDEPLGFHDPTVDLQEGPPSSAPRPTSGKGSSRLYQA
jgi:hypothetical protein